MMHFAWGISGCGSELEVEGDVVGRIKGKVCELRSRDLKRGGELSADVLDNICRPHGNMRGF
jgi:hypothetical protein